MRTQPPQERKKQLALAEIAEALEGLRYGSVTITVQDGIVIQIDRTEKKRLDYSGFDRVGPGEGI